jgi:hypothetical protein
MPGQSAEEAAETYANAVLRGDMATILHYLTPDGLAKMMATIGLSYFNYLSYQVGPPVADSDDFLFDIAYETDQEPLTLRHRFRRIEGEWKAVDLDRV